MEIIGKYEQLQCVHNITFIHNKIIPSLNGFKNDLGFYIKSILS